MPIIKVVRRVTSKLGGRHAIYGVRREDYIDFSAALASTVAKYVIISFFGKLLTIYSFVAVDRTQQILVSEAWSQMLQIVVAQMIARGESLKKDVCTSSFRKTPIFFGK